jgi:hypothetical protein
MVCNVCSISRQSFSSARSSREIIGSLWRRVPLFNLIFLCWSIPGNALWLRLTSLRLGRLQTIHLLPASLEDAIKMRRGLVIEIGAIQRKIEARQGNAPGYLKRMLDRR